MDPPVSPIALNVAPLNAPHKALGWQALADLDYNISEEMLSRSRFHLQILNEIKIKHQNGTDILGIWDSSLPIFKLPQVNQFLELIHLCVEYYDASQRAVLDSSGAIRFLITPEAIREML